MNKETLLHRLEHNKTRLIATLKYMVFSILVGIILGVIGSLFSLGVSYATTLRTHHWQFLLLLPVGAILIQFAYHMLRKKDHTASYAGTNLILAAIHSNEEIPLRMTPLIFFSSIFSHLCGASVGREGAALQMGGSIGNAIGRLFHLETRDKHTIIMCGMSAAFSAVFGTPMAAAIFSMEVVSVGIMHYAALVPCVIASFTAHAIAKQFFGLNLLHYDIGKIPTFDPVSAIQISILAILCGFISILFCVSLHNAEKLANKYLKNVYVRALIGGLTVLILSFLIGRNEYNGISINLVQHSINGTAHWQDFLLKIIFTSLSLAAGYKGGEIVPTFVIGATFGGFIGPLLGLSPAICAACGMGAVFCGVTNCPITSLLICLEIFGMDGMPYFLLSVALSYMMSGYYGLYRSQKIVYSKYRSNYINKDTE